MKPKSYHRFFRVIAVALFSLSSVVVAQTVASRPPKGPGNIVVRTKFGGQIFGFDIDQNGTEGVLADVKQFNNGKVLSAVETFDLKTGKILNVLNKEENGDNDIVIGIVGTSSRHCRARSRRLPNLLCQQAPISSDKSSRRK